MFPGQHLKYICGQISVDSLLQALLVIRAGIFIEPYIDIINATKEKPNHCHLYAMIQHLYPLSLGHPNIKILHAICSLLLFKELKQRLDFTSIESHTIDIAFCLNNQPFTPPEPRNMNTCENEYPKSNHKAVDRLRVCHTSG